MEATSAITNLDLSRPEGQLLINLHGRVSALETHQSRTVADINRLLNSIESVDNGVIKLGLEIQELKAVQVARNVTQSGFLSIFQWIAPNLGTVLIAIYLIFQHLLIVPVPLPIK